MRYIYYRGSIPIFRGVGLVWGGGGPKFANVSTGGMPPGICRSNVHVIMLLSGQSGEGSSPPPPPLQKKEKSEYATALSINITMNG